MKDIVLQNSAPIGERSGIVLEEEESTSLRDYWVVIYRHRRAAIAFLLLSVFLTAISIRWEKPLYTAKTTLYVPAQNRGVLDAPEPIVPGRASNDQQKLLTSRSLIAKVIKTLELEQNEDFNYQPFSVLGWVTSSLRNSVREAVGWVGESELGKSILEALGMGPEEPKPAIPFEYGVHPALIDGYFERLKITGSPESQLLL
jgi:uncharacterized protein involved in exopolysaccharide biosynthesis